MHQHLYDVTVYIILLLLRKSIAPKLQNLFDRISVSKSQKVFCSAYLLLCAIKSDAE